MLTGGTYASSGVKPGEAPLTKDNSGEDTAPTSYSAHSKTR